MRVGLTLRICVPVACMLALSACGGGSDGSATNTSAALGPETGTSSAVQIAAATYSVKQSSGSATVTVQRSGNSTAATSVAYSTADGSAKAGSDYTAVSGTLSWTNGDTTTKTVSIPVSNATNFSGSKSFALALSNPADGTSIGTPASTTITIAGNGTGAGSGTSAPGTVAFSASSYSIAQTLGTVSVTVNRIDGSAGAIQVSYATAAGSAVAGTNFTATSGTLSWSDGDSGDKSVSIPISSANVFSGTKTFSVALSAPTGGATLGTVSSATVAIAGSGAGTPTSGGPSAVSNLTLVSQGGPNHNATNIQQMSWSAATAGANPVSYYKIYRNGVSYATTSSLSYTDSNAPKSNDPTYATAATVYSYEVAAVDAAGVEGPKSSNMSLYAYRNGKSNWGNNDLSYGSLQENYSSTAGNPQGGTYDISVYFQNGGFQPAVAPPQAPEWDLEIGAFGYFVIDVNPGAMIAGNTLPFGTVSRLPPGDVYGWHPSVNVFDYGPAPVANKWATYKIPLQAVAMGACDFTGSISGNTLTVTAIVNGEPLVDAGGFVTGPGVPAGTYITAYGQHSAIGTFTVAGPGISASTHVASAKLTYQRTSLYKFGMQPTIQNTTMYFNNMGFTTN
ncbi:MAG: hypothetical protein JSR66_15535 [Proteobacteria bacterium]|nr:hypothetical protein [Pseudomonadota bacterium]